MSTKPPRENLVRTMSEPPELDRATESDMPTLRGHFAVWDSWTEINSAFEGRFMERFAPSSMTKTLTEGRDNMRVLFQHGRDPQIGDKPLGPIARLEPDPVGAYYEVPLLDTARKWYTTLAVKPALVLLNGTYALPPPTVLAGVMVP
mgnify:CR=1 FL=1